MKVGVFHPPFHQRHFGGSLAVTIPVINSLSASGHEVILFTSNNIDQLKIKEMLGTSISHSVKIVKKSSILTPQDFLGLYENGVNLLGLKLKCDFVIDTYSNAVFPWTDVCYIHFPYINNYSFNQHFPYLKKKRGLQRSINIPYVYLEKNLESFDNKLILANSQFTSNAIRDSLKVNAKVLYPPISNTFFQENSGILDSNLRENVVITIGRIVPYKKMETIPKIASLMKERNVKFVIIGFAHDMDSLKKINAQIKELNLEKKITILTDVPRKEIRQLLGTAKVYLHPPTLEHFGISIAEAMAMGCLPVVYNKGGVKEFVPTEYQYETIQEASNRIDAALAKWTPAEAMKMTKIAEQFSESNFSVNFSQLLSAYLNETGKF